MSDTIEVHVTCLTSSNMNFSIENSHVTSFLSILKMSLWLVNLECVTFFLRCDHHLPKQKMGISFSIWVDMLLPKVFWWKNVRSREIGREDVFNQLALTTIFFHSGGVIFYVHPKLGEMIQFFSPIFFGGSTISNLILLMEEILLSSWGW